MCVLITSTVLILRRIQRDLTDHTCTQVFMYSIRYSCWISVKLEFSVQILEKYPHTQLFMKTTPMGAELLHADRRTDMTKLLPRVIASNS